eukprot:1159798-Pelagomonas_calceolata.AAC.9
MNWPSQEVTEKVLGRRYWAHGVRHTAAPAFLQINTNMARLGPMQLKVHIGGKTGKERGATTKKQKGKPEEEHEQVQTAN